MLFARLKVVDPRATVPSIRFRFRKGTPSASLVGRRPSRCTRQFLLLYAKIGVPPGYELRRVSADGGLAAGWAFLAFGIEGDDVFKNVVELALKLVNRNWITLLSEKPQKWLA